MTNVVYASSKECFRFYACYVMVPEPDALKLVHAVEWVFA